MNNHKQLYTKFTKDLSDKTRDIFERRFGVKTGNPETLESIGKSFGITRERVRQIEETGFNIIRKKHKDALSSVSAEFASYFEKNGGFKREDKALEDLGGNNQKAYVLFLLGLCGNKFSRIAEKKDFHYFWSTMNDPKNEVKAILTSLTIKMKEVGKPILQKDFYNLVAKPVGLSENSANSYLEVSKQIQLNKEGYLGLSEWPEIKPRGVRDKAFLVFKKHNKPLHFTQVASLIDELEYNTPNKKTYSQTVHNELIKDARFVLVGRGTYALSEWGYIPGTIKDVITNILQKNQEPIDREELVKQVLSQRLVAKNTVLMNLNNKQHFHKDDDNKYSLKNIQSA